MFSLVRIGILVPFLWLPVDSFTTQVVPFSSKISSSKDSARNFPLFYELEKSSEAAVIVSETVQSENNATTKPFNEFLKDFETPQETSPNDLLTTLKKTVAVLKKTVPVMISKQLQSGTTAPTPIPTPKETNPAELLMALKKTATSLKKMVQVVTIQREQLRMMQDDLDMYRRMNLDEMQEELDRYRMVNLDEMQEELDRYRLMNLDAMQEELDQYRTMNLDGMQEELDRYRTMNLGEESVSNTAAYGNSSAGRSQADRELVSLLKEIDLKNSNQKSQK